MRMCAAILLMITGVSISNIQSVSAQVVRPSNVRSSVTEIEPGSKWKVTLSARDRWFDTGIRVTGGTMIRMTASGTVAWAPSGPGKNKSPIVGPKGTRCQQDKTHFPMPEVDCGALIMRVNGALYAVGDGGFIEIDQSGTIQLTVNDDVLLDNSSSFSIDIKLARVLDRREANGFSFDLMEAQMNAGNVVCYLIVTSVNRDVEISQGSSDDARMVDNFGNQYYQSRITFANQGSKANLVANTPTISTVEFRKVDPSANRIALIELRYWTDDEHFTVSFRNVPLTR